MSAFEFNATKKSITFDVAGKKGTTGFCDIAVAKDRMWGTMTITKDGILLNNGTDYIRNQNSTFYLFHVSHNHSNHTIEITGYPSYSRILIASYDFAIICDGSITDSHSIQKKEVGMSVFVIYAKSLNLLP